MEAATPLRHTHVAVLGNRLVVDGLVVEDATAVALVREREEAGADPAQVVGDAIEIGARVLQREQTGAAADFVKAEFEKASAEVEQAFTEKARTVAEFFGGKVDEVFAPDSGHLIKALEKHFSDSSSAAVQHRVRDVVQEVMTRTREDLIRQFSAGDASNPLAQFQTMVVGSMRQAAAQQNDNLQRMQERMAALEVHIARLHAEREKALELAAEAGRGTAKGRSFEEAVAEALDRIALAQGDDCDAVGDVKGATGRTGDVVVDIEACRGPSRGRIVFEAKMSRLSKPKAIEELDRAREQRGADYAVLVVPSEEQVPARLQALREYNGDKLVVCFDPEEGSTLSLEVAYALARARVLMARGETEGVDVAAIRDATERAMGSLSEVTRIKQQLTGATTSIEKAREIVESLASQVRGHLAQIEMLLDAAPDAAGDEVPAVAPPARPELERPAPSRTAALAAPRPATAAGTADGPPRGEEPLF